MTRENGIIIYENDETNELYNGYQGIVVTLIPELLSKTGKLMLSIDEFYLDSSKGSMERRHIKKIPFSAEMSVARLFRKKIWWLIENDVVSRIVEIGYPEIAIGRYLYDFMLSTNS